MSEAPAVVLSACKEGTKTGYPSSLPLVLGQWSDLLWFSGHLYAQHLPLLPRGLSRLYLAAAGEEEAPRLLSALQHVREYWPDLRYLGIHVPVSSVTAASLTSLPPRPIVYLLLSGVGDGEVEAACRIAAVMCPREESYRDIRFPGSSLGFGGYRRVLEGLGAAGVRVSGGVFVPDTVITKAEMEELNTFAESLMGCGFYRYSIDVLWSRTRW
ncbi:uncharacterized protein LOC127010185 [Eriocheir sinensis]|uniref:uncharacterized protein LOC127010185 n=1 Tax=Eriocheir sinensis TaxID=95602 RepID=UPI0021CA11C3|nr:uncharacterized protein LOC127010185 [Eriocheir sinensis]